jgi:hypothetical protein
MRLSKIEQLQQQVVQSQFALSLNPETLLNIELAAPVCKKTALTFRVDVTRRPESLPRLTRIGRRVFVRVSDLLEFISAPHPLPQQPQPPRARPGRPTNAERAARGGGVK